MRTVQFVVLRSGVRDPHTVQRLDHPPVGAFRMSGGAVVDNLRDLDEALFHLALANLPDDMRQQRIDEILDRRLALMRVSA